MKKTISGYTGPAAVAHLVGRLHESEVEGLSVEIVHTNDLGELIMLTDRGYSVLLTAADAEATLRAMKKMVLADPAQNTPQIGIVAEALLTALRVLPPFATVH